MQTLRVPSVLAQRTIHTATHISWLVRAIASLGCAMIFAIGCAHIASVPSPLAGSEHASTGTHRSNKSIRENERLGSTRIVTASWYGPGYVAKTTASGERFDPNRLTVASKTLPLGSVVRVTNLQNGRSVKVKVNDRGPHIRSRSLDLSPAAAQRIGLSDRGVARVKVTPVSKPLSESDLLKLLAGGVYSTRIATIVRERGINFKPTSHDLQSLRRAGADNELERAVVAAHGDTSQIAAGP
jgi:rare lipoprotein A (peptidoglycan hydrolase)